MRSVWSSIALLSAGVALGGGSIYVLKNRVEGAALEAAALNEVMKEKAAISKLDPLFFSYPIEELVVRWEAGKPAIVVSVTLKSRQVNLAPTVEANLKRVIDLILLHLSEKMDAIRGGGAAEVQAFELGLIQELNVVLADAKLVDLSIDEIRVSK